MDETPDQGKTYVVKVLIAVGIELLTAAVIALLVFTFDVVLLVFAAVLLSIFLRGLAEQLGRLIKIKEVWLVLIVSLALVVVLGGAIALLAPSIADQVRFLRVELPESIDAARNYISQFGWGRAILEQLPDPKEIWNNIVSGGFLTRVGGLFSSTIGALGNVAVVILLAIYFAVEPKFYLHGFTSLFPVHSRPRVSEILSRIGETLRWWLIGKAGSMIFIGILTWIALSILGVPLALTLGLIAGLFSFIPNFGPILSAIPAVLIAFVQSPTVALYTIFIYVGVQLIESNLVTPLIERETVELSPGLVIIVQLMLAIIVGGLGLVLATPLVAVLVVIVQMVYIEGVLGDRGAADEMPPARTEDVEAIVEGPPASTA